MQPELVTGAEAEERATTVMSDKEAQQHEEDMTVVKKKLENPMVELPADEKLRCLRACLHLALAASQKARGKHAVVVIGNTGAGAYYERLSTVALC